MHLSRPVWYGLIALLALVAGSVSWVLAAQSAGVHPVEMACETCHLAGKLVSPEQAHLLVASQEKLCGRCHQTLRQVSHPSGFVPRNKLPVEYPADWKGDLTCSTCHDVHGKTRGFMRGTKMGREFCLGCHDAKFFVRMRDQGASMMETGHLDARTSVPGARLDAYSRQCMECHGGSGDNRDTHTTRVDQNMVVRHGASSLNHPVGASYADAVKFGGYRAASKLSQKVMLPGGLVSCVSCHEGFSANHGRLVITDKNSALCMECHDL